MSAESTIRVYTDGACSNNGGPGARAGIGVFFGEGDPRNYSGRIEGKQTNNTAELGALLYVSQILGSEIAAGRQVEIYSDSQYALRCCTTYGAKLKAKGWRKGKKPVANLELVKRAYNAYEGLVNVAFHYVPAHTGRDDPHSVGNDGADRLANQAIGLTTCPYASSRKTHGHRIYLKVPYEEKEEAKKYGARWDPSRKKWYLTPERANALTKEENDAVWDRWGRKST